MVKGASDDRHDAAFVSFESDKRSRVEDGRAHRPSARSAAFCSARVRGPPVSVSISFSSEAKSSSFACSSSARAT